jgi:hypothetical protein
MELEIYGFRAKISRDGRYLIGEIPELHIQDQAKDLKELESELKDAVSLVINFIIANPKDAAKSFRVSVIRKVKVQPISA